MGAYKVCIVQQMIIYRNKIELKRNHKINDKTKYLWNKIERYAYIEKSILKKKSSFKTRTRPQCIFDISLISWYSRNT